MELIEIGGRRWQKYEGDEGQAVYVDNNGCASTAINGGSLVGVALETNSDEAEKLVECILKV